MSCFNLWEDFFHGFSYMYVDVRGVPSSLWPMRSIKHQQEMMCKCGVVCGGLGFI